MRTRCGALDVIVVAAGRGCRSAVVLAIVACALLHDTTSCLIVAV